MSNFVKAFLQGKEGDNFGLTTGITALDVAINKIQRGYSYGVAAAPKCGKTTLVDFSFVLNPYLEAERLNTIENIEWIYFSFEIDRISKEFKYAAFFMAYDFNVYTFIYKGTLYEMNQDYLQGKQLHKNEDGTTELIIIFPEHEEMLKEIYIKRIIPLFGEWDENGNCIRKGRILFIEDRENPTGMWKLIRKHAWSNGKVSTQNYEVLSETGTLEKRSRIVGYTPNNPKKFTIVITDHVRKLKEERQWAIKQIIDKWVEYSTELRNLYKYTFVHVVHSNRNLSNTDRLKYAGEFIFPTGDDTKDSGNIAEECTVLMTLFNPNDEKYNITKHFGVELKEFPKYRSIHITESRYTDCPVHIQTNMYGGINMFTPLNFNN